MIDPVSAASQALNVAIGIGKQISEARKKRRIDGNQAARIYSTLLIRAGFSRGLRVEAGQRGARLRRQNLPRGQVSRNTYVFMPDYSMVPEHLWPVLRTFLDDVAKGNDSEAMAALQTTRFFRM